jgi:orotate phosphoribosyltransferase-like protein
MAFFRARRARKIREEKLRNFRRALRMRENGYSNAEIAKAMNLDEMSVRRLLKEDKTKAA